MPNHITNIISASPSVLAALIRTPTQEEFEAHAQAEDERFTRFVEKGRTAEFVPDVLDMDKKLIDFNLIIPCPPEDDPQFTAERTDYGNGMVGYSFDGYSPMDWQSQHWGTKWNAYSQQVAETQLEFDTAWSHPFPVLQELSKKFPAERIEVGYADEDFGSNLGHYIMQNGEIITDLTPAGEDEINEFAARILYKKPYAEVRKEWAAYGD